MADRAMLKCSVAHHMNGNSPILLSPCVKQG